MPDLATLPHSIVPLVLESRLRVLVADRKVDAHFVRWVRQSLRADAAWIFLGDRRSDQQDPWRIDGDHSLCAEEVTRAFFRDERPEVPARTLLAPVRVRGRLHGVVGVARRDEDFVFGQGHFLNRQVSVLVEDLARREDERMDGVLNRIREEVLSELRPRDLAYQILDGLYRLVQYDHSAALLIHNPSHGVLRVDAEKIVWAKAKSAFVGHEVAVEPGLLQRLAPGPNVVKQFEAPSPGAPKEDQAWAALHYNRGEGIPSPGAIICAPIFLGAQVLGLLRIAKRGRVPFSDRDLAVVKGFLPAAAVSLRNARLRLSLEDQAIRAEGRAGLVTLARAVAHDVNNALGAMLPLAEQARDDVEAGRLDRDSLLADLSVIRDKAHLCKRVFSNMLRLGIERSGSGPVSVNQLVIGMRDLLQAYTGARGIRLVYDLADDVPVSRFSKPHLEHVLWNLVTNAVDAMTGRRGRIVVATRNLDAHSAVLTVSDDGPGIPPEHLDRVLEPFFSTKSDGTGLGLSICRSIAWQYGGGLEIDSTPGHGTEVRVRLPHMAPATANPHA